MFISQISGILLFPPLPLPSTIHNIVHETCKAIWKVLKGGGQQRNGGWKSAMNLKITASFLTALAHWMASPPKVAPSISNIKNIFQ